MIGYQLPLAAQNYEIQQMSVITPFDPFHVTQIITPFLIEGSLSIIIKWSYFSQYGEILIKDCFSIENIYWMSKEEEV